MEKFLEELEEMTLEQVLERKSQLETEIRSAENADSISDMEEKIEAVNKRIAELREIESRKRDAEAIQTGEAENVVVVEERKNHMSEREKRAKQFAQSGKTETRVLLSTGKIAKPSQVDGISGLADTAVGIVDDVHAVPLTGTGAWIVGYKKTDAIAADVTDGSTIGGTASTYDYVTINPAEWGVTDELSNQVKKMSPLDYLAAIEDSALIALRVEASAKIVTAVKASALIENKTYALDQDYLRSVILGFRSIKTKGAVKLYISQGDIATLGKVRGTNEKKPLYEITFDDESTTSGVIKEGGLAVKFRILDELSDGEQLFGQPGAIDMPMWDDYAIETNEGGEYFKKNLIGVRGIQTANADLVAYHGMQLIANA